MVTLKIGDTPTTIAFGVNSYVDKLSARNIQLDETNPSELKLKVDFSHYSKRKRGDLEDSDFECLQRSRNLISKLVIRDETVAKKIKPFPSVAMVEIEIDSEPVFQLTVSSQTVDYREVTLQF